MADRVNSVNRMLRTADNRILLRVDSMCRETMMSLEQTLWKTDGSREIDKDANVEHITDALGYPIEYQYPIRKVEIIGVSI